MGKSEKNTIKRASMSRPAPMGLEAGMINTGTRVVGHAGFII